MTAKAKPLSAAEFGRQATRTVAEVAAFLTSHPDTVRTAIDRGEIRVLRLGRKILIPTAPLLEQLGADDGRPE